MQSYKHPTLQQAITASLPLLYEAHITSWQHPELAELSTAQGLTETIKTLSTSFVLDQQIELDTIWDMASYPQNKEGFDKLVCLCGSIKTITSYAAGLRYHCPKCAGKYQYTPSWCFKFTFADILQDYAEQISKDCIRLYPQLAELQFAISIAQCELILAKYIYISSSKIKLESNHD